MYFGTNELVTKLNILSHSRSLYFHTPGIERGFFKVRGRETHGNFQNGCTNVSESSYRSSSSSGREIRWASSKSASICFCQLGSIWTSGGWSAGMATNSKLGSPISLRASQRKGFSKL